MTGPKVEGSGHAPAAMIHRRGAIAALGMGSALAVLGAAAAEATGTPEAVAFRRLSAALTGIPAEDLPGFGEQILAALSAPGRPKAGLDALLALARETSPETIGTQLHGTALEPLARAVAAAWYTGMLGSGAGARLLSYEDALVWRAAGYEGAPSLCGGEFGHWAEPPAAAAR